MLMTRWSVDLFFWQRNDTDKYKQCPQNKQEVVQSCSQKHLSKNDLDVVYSRWEAHRQRSYLVSVSGCCNKSVMWAHYADKHKGVVIGIDFNEIRIPFYELIPKEVNYSDFRLKIDILAPLSVECFQQAMYSKSMDWRYENEFRCVCSEFELERWEKKGFTRFGFSGEKKSCFLRLNHQCIKEIIWGLYTEEALEVTVRKLLSCPELQHVKLYQVKESDECDFDVIDPETGLSVR